MKKSIIISLFGIVLLYGCSSTPNYKEASQFEIFEAVSNDFGVDSPEFKECMECEAALKNALKITESNVRFRKCSEAHVRYYDFCKKIGATKAEQEFQYAIKCDIQNGYISTSDIDRIRQMWIELDEVQEIKNRQIEERGREADEYFNTH